LHEWTEKLKNSITSVEDSPRPGPAFTAVTEDNIAAVENGPILEHYMRRRSTVTSATYSKLLRENLKPVIRQKQRRLLTTGVCLLHDNVRPHTATATVSTIEELWF
jgi:hypothetical protein